MFWIYKENRKLKEKIKLLEEEIDSLKEQLHTIKRVNKNKLKPCKFCGWEVVYTWNDAHWIADIKCADCWAKWFVNIMFL